MNVRHPSSLLSISSHLVREVILTLVDYQEDLEPGQIRLEDMLQNPKTKNQAVLYKMVSPVVGRGKNARKQTLETRPALSNDEDNGESSGQEEIVALDSDQASTSGTQFVMPKVPPKARGKRQPPAAAAASAAKKRAAEEAMQTPKPKVTKGKQPPSAVSQQEGDEESDESNMPSGNEGEDSETRAPPKKKRTYTSRVPKEIKRPTTYKGSD